MGLFGRFEKYRLDLAELELIREDLIFASVMINKTCTLKAGYCEYCSDWNCDRIGECTSKLNITGIICQGHYGGRYCDKVFLDWRNVSSQSLSSVLAYLSYKDGCPFRLNGCPFRLDGCPFKLDPCSFRLDGCPFRLDGCVMF